ncbi:MAG: hypothetical protein GX445_03435 [Elusimicrobia bacterium]|nr:hypothetical protein [Elusimicrobiota bacterium]
MKKIFNMMLFFLILISPIDIYANTENDLIDLYNSSFNNDNIIIPTPDFSIDDDKSSILVYLLGRYKKLNESEESKISVSLNILSQTITGNILCSKLGVQDCTRRELSKINLEFRKGDLLSSLFGEPTFYAFVPPPSQVNKRKIICIDEGFLDTSDVSVTAHFIAHEISHVYDNKIFGEYYHFELYEGKIKPRMNQLRMLFSEYKAVFIQMSIYNELVTKKYIKRNRNDAIDFLLSIYRWKETGNIKEINLNFTNNVGNKTYTAKDYMNICKKVKNGRSCIYELTKIFCGINLSNMNLSNDEAQRNYIYIDFVIKNVKEYESKYKNFFPPTQPIEPENNNTDNNDNNHPHPPSPIQPGPVPQPPDYDPPWDDHNGNPSTPPIHMRYKSLIDFIEDNI